MIKRLFAILFIACSLGCEKKQQSVGCGTGACTLSFAMVGIHFKDKNGNAVAVQNLTAINQRTKQSVLPAGQQGINEPGYYIITDDSMRAKFSDDGDEVIVSGTDSKGQTKTVTFKISGGCNCHVAKLSGEQTIVFE
jgi:phage protein U